MSKHTKGPWNYNTGPGLKAVVFTESKFRIAECLPNDARLISCAPDLLAGLKDAISSCPCSVAERLSGHRVDCSAPEWQAIVAKAEGKE